MRLLRFLKWLAFALVILPIADKHLLGQIEVTPAIRFAVATPEVRDSLAADWDRHVFDFPYRERGYCGYYTVGVWANSEPAYIVYRVTAPDMTVGQPGVVSIDFRCLAVNAIPIHVHPPRSCPTSTTCTWDGMYAYQCLPSDNDRGSLTYYAYAFGIVQCERKALRTYWPIGVAGL